MTTRLEIEIKATLHMDIVADPGEWEDMSDDEQEAYIVDNLDFHEQVLDYEITGIHY